MNLKNLFSLLAVLLISGMNVLKAQNPYCNPCTNSPCLTVSFGNDCSCPMRWVFTQGSNPVCSESLVSMWTIVDFLLFKSLVWHVILVSVCAQLELN